MKLISAGIIVFLHSAMMVKIKPFRQDLSLRKKVSQALERMTLRMTSRKHYHLFQFARGLRLSKNCKISKTISKYLLVLMILIKKISGRLQLCTNFIKSDRFPNLPVWSSKKTLSLDLESIKQVVTSIRRDPLEKEILPQRKDYFL